MKTKISIRGYTTILVASILYGTYGVWSRLMGDTFPPFYQAYVRSALIMLIMLPLMLATKSFCKISRKDWPQMAVFVGFCIFTQVPLYYAFNHAPIGTVQLLFYSVFIITAYIVGRFFLGETITRVKLLSMLLAFVGLTLVFGVSVIAFAPLGLGLAMFNGVASGAETSFSKKVSSKYPPAQIIFWGWAFTFLTHLPVSLLLHEKQVSVHFNHAWLWLVTYSFVNAAAFWLSIEGFRLVDASIGSLIGLTEVIFSVIFGSIIFHQLLTTTIYAGGALILVAAMLPDLVSIIQHKKTKTKVELPVV